MCPGIGLYSFLARKVGTNNADKIIRTARLYTAHEMREMGAITDIAVTGDGKRMVDRYMKEYSRSFDVMQTLHAAKMRFAPLEYDELEYMVGLWIEAMTNLNDEQIARLKKIAKSQQQQIYEISRRLRTKQDRRLGLWEAEFPIIDSDGNLVEQDRRHRPDPRNKD